MQDILDEQVECAANLPCQLVIAASLQPGAFQILTQGGEIRFHDLSTHAHRESRFSDVE